MKIDILGVLVDNLTFSQVLEKVETFITEGGPHYVVTPYAESIVRAQTDSQFREILNQADLAVPDGVSLLMAAKYLQQCNHETMEQSGKKADWQRLLYCLRSGVRVGFSVFSNHSSFDVLSETVKGTDLMVALCRLASEKGWRVMLLGGWDGVGVETAKVLRRQYPTLSIEATEGCKSVESETEAEWLVVKEKLAQFKPDLLFVAYGPAVQEKWIARHLSELSAGVAIGVAGAFDMISGRRWRAPVFLRNHGLEWLWRLFIEPTRIRRILTAFPYFPLLVFRKSLN